MFVVNVGVLNQHRGTKHVCVVEYILSFENSMCITGEILNFINSRFQNLSIIGIRDILND